MVAAQVFLHFSQGELNVSFLTDQDIPPRELPFKVLFYSSMDFIYGIAIPLLALGLTANTLNIIVYVRTGCRDNVTVSFLALSVSDLSFLAVISLRIIPFALEQFLVLRLKKRIDWLIDPRVLTHTFEWYAFVFYETSILITVYISVVRCACVAIPFRVKRAFTVRRAIFTFIVCFISLALLRVPMFMKRRIVHEYDPSSNTTRVAFRVFEDGGLAGRLNDIVNRNVLNWVSMTTVITCLVVMVTKLRASAKFRSAMVVTRPSLTNETSPAVETGSKNGKPRSQCLSMRETQVLRCVILVAVVFVSCQLLQMAYTVARRVLAADGPQDVGLNPHKYVYLFNLCSRASTVFSMVNASVNIFVYYNFNSRYRQTMKALWKRN